LNFAGSGWFSLRWPLDKTAQTEHEGGMATLDPRLPPVPISSDEKIWAIACHLSLLLGVGFLLPFIVWLAKRHDSPVVTAHACAALNFHISIFVYGVVCIPLVFLLVGIPLLLLLGLASVILAIIAAIEASNGGFFHYPLCLPIFR
jgi:uncharacterized Tic20 family protein